MTSIEKLKAVYDMEMNIRIESFWDGGYTIFLGDDMNGYVETKGFNDLEKGIDWLFKMAEKHTKN